MLKRSIIFIAIFSLVALPFFFRQEAQAATLTSISDTLSRAGTTDPANHTIAFTLVTSWEATETVVIDFTDADGFDTTGFANTDANDYDITWAGTDKPLVANGACVANSIEITTVNTSTDTFTFTLCAGSTASGGTDAIVIEIGTHALFGGTGDDQIDNATGAGSKTISITGPGGDSGQFALAILTDDQVVVSATVDPTISSSLSATTCLLGTLSSTTIDVCTYSNTVLTNAASGFSSTILEDGELRDGANDINQETGDGDVDQGSEEYGVSSDDTTAVAINETDGSGCDGTNPEVSSAITGTAQVYATHTGAVDVGDADEVTNLCHAVSITPITPAGSYSHIVTHITTGIF